MDAAVRSTIEELGDLELATLLCLVGEQHCIVKSDEQDIDRIGDQLQQTSHRTFNKSCTLIDCSQGLTLDDFREQVLVEPLDNSEESSLDLTYDKPLPTFKHLDVRPSSERHLSVYSNSLDERKVANVVIVKHLEQATHHVQVQALELLRTGRLFSHTAMHATSHSFLFIALSGTNAARLPPHLNDLFSISHHHDADNGPQKSMSRKWSFDDAASLSSVVRSSPHRLPSNFGDLPHISHQDLQYLQECLSRVKMSAEVAAYLSNVTVFMRWHRYIAGGVTAMGSRHLRVTVKALAVLHGLSFVTPSLVALAIRKTYPHRLIIATSETERSLQWGSDAASVEQSLEGVTPEVAIDAVLATVETPL